MEKIQSDRRWLRFLLIAISLGAVLAAIAVILTNL